MIGIALSLVVVAIVLPVAIWFGRRRDDRRRAEAIAALLRRIRE